MDRIRQQGISGSLLAEVTGGRCSDPPPGRVSDSGSRGRVISRRNRFRAVEAPELLRLQQRHGRTCEFLGSNGGRAMQVKEIMTKDVACCTPETGLRDVTRLMVEQTAARSRWSTTSGAADPSA